MKYIDVSKKIHLTKEATQEDIKQALLMRIRGAFGLDSLTEKESGFHFIGTTGGGKGITKHAQLDLNVTVAKNQETVRIMITGHSDMSKSLMISYTALFFIILLVGLLPGSIETNGANSGALDALVFLLFGIFIFFDINKKLAEPTDHLRSALESLDTEFG